MFAVLVRVLLIQPFRDYRQFGLSFHRRHSRLEQGKAPEEI